MLFTRNGNAGKLVRMKKRLQNLSLSDLLALAQEAGREAAGNAVAAGRVVTGWNDGKIVEYGPGACPLSRKLSEREKAHARIG